MSLDPQKIAAVIDIGINLVNAGMGIVATIKDKDSLTDADILALIQKQDDLQAKAKADLEALLSQ